MTLAYRCGVMICALVVFMVVAQVAHASETTFDVDVTIGGESVTGTITTIAGVVGALTNAEIVSTDLTYNGNGTLTIDDPTGADTALVGDDLTETADALYFNYEGEDGGAFDPDLFYTGPGNPTNWFNVTVTGNALFAPDGLESIQTPNGVGYAGVHGNVAIAEVAPLPEPSTAVLWLTGIALMILTRRRIGQFLRLGMDT
jgi:hypothetical protein